MIRGLLMNQIYENKIAIIENGKEIPYSVLIQKALALQSLLPLTLRENIAILLPNSGDYIAAFWGTVFSGMTAFPLNAQMTRHEMAPLIKQASVSMVVTSTAYRRVFEEFATLEAIPLKMIYMDELKPTACENQNAAAEVGTGEAMVLLSTSGTTGKPKIVQLSERNVEASVLGYLEKMSFTEEDLQDARFVLAVPFSSVYGLMILSACLTQSFPIVLLDPVFTLDELYRAAEKHRVTHYEGSASAILLMERMAGRSIPYNIHTLKYFGFGGSKVSGSTLKKVLGAYPGIGLFQGYGMTEAAPLIAKHPRKKLEKTDSVGTAIQGLEIAVEVENAITHAPNTRGEIVVRGPNVMSGYYHNLDGTNRVLKNGYLYTGDIGYLDEEGYLYICGRKKNMIIVRGFNVYPEEVEACIQESLLVKDCHVYGQTDAFGNEVVCADVVPMHSQVREDTIRLYCEAHLAAYKQPQKILFLDAITKNASGKTQRKEKALYGTDQLSGPELSSGMHY